MDWVHAFLAEAVIFEGGGFASNDETKPALEAWNSEYDDDLTWADIAKAFRRRDCRSGTRRVGGKAVRGWHGVRLTPSTEDSAAGSGVVQATLEEVRE